MTHLSRRRPTFAWSNRHMLWPPLRGVPMGFSCRNVRFQSLSWNRICIAQTDWSHRGTYQTQSTPWEGRCCSYTAAHCSWSTCCQCCSAPQLLVGPAGKRGENDRSKRVRDMSEVRECTLWSKMIHGITLTSAGTEGRESSGHVPSARFLSMRIFCSSTIWASSSVYWMSQENSKVRTRK